MADERLLVVDDDTGFIVDLAHDGETALTMVAANEPDKATRFCRSPLSVEGIDIPVVRVGRGRVGGGEWTGRSSDGSRSLLSVGLDVTVVG